MPQNAANSWETLPEFIASRTFVRCVDRLFQSLPPEVQWKMFQPMLSATVSISAGIACFHGEPVPPRRYDRREREESRERALDAIRAAREGLDKIERVPTANRAELMVARELLERIEGSVRDAVAPR